MHCKHKLLRRFQYAVARITVIFAVALSVSCPTYSQRVFMTGDSHVAGKIYPETVKEVLTREQPEIEFSYWGKNGASFNSFNESREQMNIIYDADPDVLVVNLGTNDSYSTNFDEERFTKNVAIFYNNIQSNLPGCAIVFITPFYNKNKAKGTGKWTVNENTRICADALIDFAFNHHNVYIIDNNAFTELEFIEGDGLIRDDNVHLTVAGYKMLGQDVANALLDFSGLLNEEESDIFSDDF